MNRQTRGRWFIASWLALVAVAAQAFDASQVYGFLQRQQAENGSPGMSAAVAVNGQIVFSGGVGVADLQSGMPQNGRSVHNIGSISKTHAVVAIMQLVEQGKIDLDAPVQTWAPWFPKKQRPITLRMVLTHTSGIRHYKDGEFGAADVMAFRQYDNIEESTRFWRDDPLLFEPGKYWSYSSFATNLLHAVVENASGEGYEEYLRKHVWLPAGMLDTQFDVPARIVPRRGKGYVRNPKTGVWENAPDENVSYKYAGGGVISTDEDLLRFALALNAGKLLNARSLAEMYRLQLPRDIPYPPEDIKAGQARPSRGQSQALIWRIATDPAGRVYVGHSGSVKGTGSMLANYKDQGVVVALHINGEGGGKVGAAAEQLAQLFLPTGRISRANGFDVLIQGGSIVDGSGQARFKADVGISGDTIVAVGDLSGAVATRTIAAAGKIVTPGFIDLHAHTADEYADVGLLAKDPRRRAAQNYVAQGVTTTLSNADGYQAKHADGKTMSLFEQRQALSAAGVGVNVALTTGHNALRATVMTGDLKRAASEQELRQMQEILRRDMAEHGSFGLSLGVEYVSGRYSDLNEQVKLARAAAEYSGIFIPHLRSQGISPVWYRPSADGNSPPTLDDAIDETLAVAEQTGITVVFTHMKAWGPGYRGQAQRIVARLQEARDQGLKVFMDVYPYDSSGSDGQFVALPGWAITNGQPPKDDDEDYDYAAALAAVLKQADARRRDDLARDVKHQLALKGGPENVRILDHPDANYVGKSYAELMKMRRLDQVALAIALQREGNPHWPGGARLRSFSMAEEDIAAFYKLDWSATSTDGWIVLPEEATGEKKYEKTNRRCFGSYPRRLAHYSQQLGVDTLEHAVRSASGLPAEILRLQDRGRIAAGMKADVVVLDLAALEDNTTFLEPSAYPSGIEHVLVNGRPAVDGGQRTLVLAGRVLSPSPRT